MWLWQVDVRDSARRDGGTSTALSRVLEATTARIVSSSAKAARKAARATRSPVCARPSVEGKRTCKDGGWGMVVV